MRLIKDMKNAETDGMSGSDMLDEYTELVSEINRVERDPNRRSPRRPLTGKNAIIDSWIGRLRDGILIRMEEGL